MITISGDTERRGLRIVKMIGAAVIAIFFMILVSCSITTVDTGHRGVRVRFGEVIGEGLPEGLYFVNPFTTHIQSMDTRILKWESTTQAYTRDVQQADVGFVLNYRLDPTKAHIVFQQVGTDWSAKLVGQVLLEDIKREFGQHNAVDIIAQRDLAARAIETHVKETLGRRDVVVTNFQLTNIDFTEQFEHAVEAKVVAQQKAIEEQNRTVQIEEQAKQRVATARGSAEATVLQAKAEAESILIRARALEQNAKLVDWEAVQKWDGRLPTYMMGNAVPFVNVPQQK
ncbi:MAG: prohibitin family protein [Gammaproteobacteria bacterium]|nr:prohibitin family protein [Gammaproteobacteria bacterium]